MVAGFGIGLYFTRTYKLMPKNMRDPGLVFLAVLALLSTLLVVHMLPGQSGAFPEKGTGQERQELAAVEVIPVQLTSGMSGIVLVDKRNYTLCLYQYQYTKARQGKLVLLAARNFRYDCLLQDYNTEGLTPAEVRSQIERIERLQRSAEPEEPKPLAVPNAPQPKEAQEKVQN